AEIFAEAGCSNILIAYPLWAVGAKAPRLQQLVQKTQLSVGAESYAGIDRLAEAVGEFGRSLGVVIGVDAGARGSGPPGAEAGPRARRAPPASPGGWWSRGVLGASSPRSPAVRADPARLPQKPVRSPPMPETGG